MFRMAFHGGFGNVWSALMTIPEARQVKRCMNKQESCLTYEVIRKEAGGTGENEKPRIIVNPDFVEQMVSVNSSDAKISSISLFFIRAFSFTFSQDKSDGSTQWDPEVEEQVWNNI